MNRQDAKSAKFAKEMQKKFLVRLASLAASF